jgi:hypothetical protein
MKKILFLILLATITASCERVQLPSDPELPGWLKVRIAQDEEIIRTNAHSGLEIGAWMRFNFEGDYYFEYLNLLSSSFPPIYNLEGERVMADQNDYRDYSAGKCCKKYIWKGPAYFEID